MKTTENLVCALVEEAKALSYTPASLAAKTGLPYSACHKLMSYKTRRPTAETVLLLIEAVGFSIEVKDQDGNRVWDRRGVNENDRRRHLGGD